ncbi:MAG TPA: hypothetical protein VNL15_03240 [Dehalococcoidia bacterium]|nr:hypothetical protein [Dehalococcoidia bacterium]
MRCSRCGYSYFQEDNYCRQCGASLRIQRLPVRRQSALPSHRLSPVPALVSSASVVAAGAVGQWLLRALVKQVLGQQNGKKRQLPAKRGQRSDEAEYAVTETVVMRKVSIRR